MGEELVVEEEVVVYSSGRGPNGSKCCSLQSHAQFLSKTKVCRRRWAGLNPPLDLDLAVFEQNESLQA